MEIKWSKPALNQLDKALDFIIGNGFISYAAELEEGIISRIDNLIDNYTILVSAGSLEEDPAFFQASGIAGSCAGDPSGTEDFLVSASSLALSPHQKITTFTPSN